MLLNVHRNKTKIKRTNKLKHGSGIALKLLKFNVASRPQRPSKTGFHGGFRCSGSMTQCVLVYKGGDCRQKEQYVGEWGWGWGGEREQCPSVLVLTCGMRRVLESEEKRSSLDGVYA